MPFITKDLPNLIPTSSGSASTNAVGLLDDANCITIYVASSAGTASTGASAPLSLQISQFDPAISTGLIPSGESTGFFAYGFLSTLAGVPVLTTGQAYTIPVIGFRGFRLGNLTSAVASEIVARVTAQIWV